MPNRVRQAGFTLLEVIVTLSLIVLLSSIVYVSGNYGIDRRALGRASSDVHMMLKGARAQAIMAGQDARLIVNLDQSDPDRFLRYVGIVTRDANNPARWVASHTGIYLPEGIYVVPQNTAGVAFGVWDESVSARKSRYRCSSDAAGMATTVLDYPEILAVPESNGDDWLVYQFSPDGGLDVSDAPGCSGSLPSSNNQIVLAPGVPNGAGIIEFSNSDIVAGMVIRQNGTSIEVEDPADFL